MKTIAFFCCVLLLGMITSCANSTSKEGTDESSSEELIDSTTNDYIDAVVAAADNYKLLSEEGPVRVIEMNLPVGARDNKHSHNNETVYFFSGGKASIYVGSDTVNVEIPDGFVMHHGPWMHSVENTGNTPIHALIFERMEMIQVEPMEGYLDPTAVSSEQYQELSKDGNVRIVHMTLGPGQTDTTHSHYFETVYFISGGKAKIHVGDEVVEADIPDGHIMHHRPWTHQVENAGDTPIEAIIFERMPRL